MRSSADHFNRASVSKAIYGLVTVMAVLTVLEEHPPTAWRGVATLFGTTLALALADAFAETVAGTLALRRSLSFSELREILHDVAPVMVGAQAPTVVLLLAALGLLVVEQAIAIAQAVALLLLFGYGLRVGRMLHATWLPALASGILLVAIGALIVGIKALFH